MREANWLSHSDGIKKIDELGRLNEPFLFIISYDKKKIFAQKLENLDDGIFYKLESWRNYPVRKFNRNYSFKKLSIDFEKYQKALEAVQEEIRSGNTYLLNLTFRTAIETDLALKEIFTYARARFKLYFKDEFICFSPERFIEIEDDIISSYPMK